MNHRKQPPTESAIFKTNAERHEPAVRDHGLGVEFWRDRPVLVTGASGFLGTWLVKRLLDMGGRVVGTARKPGSALPGVDEHERLRREYGDLADAGWLSKILTKHRVKSVFHAAAQPLADVAFDDPVGTFESNVAGSWRLLDACRAQGTVEQVVFASSDRVYGNAGIGLGENTPVTTGHPYDASKACAELISKAYAHSYGTPIAIARSGVLFGGGDRNWRRLVPGTILSVLRDESPVVRSDGQALLDYLYVEDAVDAYLRIAVSLAANPHLRGEAFNICNETPLTILQMVRKIIHTMGSALEPTLLSEPQGVPQQRSSSANKARELLGWNATYSLDAGLSRTIQWYRSAFTDERDGAAHGLEELRCQ